MSDALIIALTVVAYGVLHSLLASSAVKLWFRNRLGARVDRFYRLAYNSFAIISFLPTFALLVWQPGILLYRLGPPWAALAMAGQVLSTVLLVIGFLQTDVRSFLGLRQLTAEREHTPHLVVRGLYHWVRHPLYTAGLFLIWLTPVMTSGVLAFNLMLTLYVVVGSRLEERRLVAEFGVAYEEYQHRVPSLFPVRHSPRR
jgi:protein-S-isoprenylcysteine O-methyltransferase Ste14